MKRRTLRQLHPKRKAEHHQHVYVALLNAIRVTFAGRGVTGEFSFEIGKATFTITDKPCWLPEMLTASRIGSHD